MVNQKTIGVNLKFSADVSAAKRAMAELQGSLSQIHNAAVTSANPGIRYAKDLNQASQAAAQLRIQLQNAFNQDTGKLNLTKFNMEMKQAGMSVEKYRSALTSIGPQGQQAFTQLAHAITIADTHTINLSNGLHRLGTTFMNTLRYQLSSSVLMAFTSGIGEAVSYVKDLNTSLNDIRIVTGYGVDEMKEFATYANKAAKALSTTTNEYSKASLIYFQQGLNNKQVKERTDLTIKMANVTGQAVSEVSDQLTSVWNNFDNGTKPLEHYVDVMVALGAATASSSEEISEGLNKFAAVAETVGLSYEYAASALATVTATTRQSADVVGTAFKTLFARIQDLELGKELDDGTTLGEYSQALAAVGINIKDVNGEVKDMNSILDEMGAKWNTLSKDTQIALAQNVAGVRQYTQLIALMDNWDFFKQNLDTTNASTGALQEQADIYAESWEAASERVAASLETIYNKLLNDEFFIDATNLLADFIGLVENLIDGLGGMPGLLALVGTALTRVFSTQMANGINNMAYNIRSMTKAGRAENAKLQQEFSEGAAAEYGTAGMRGQQGVLAKEEALSQSAFIKNKSKMNEMQRQSLELRMKELNAQKQTLNAEIEETKTLERQAQIQKKITKEITSENLVDRRNGFADNTLDAAQQTGNKYLQNATRVQSRAVAGNRRGFFDLGASGREEAINDLQRSSAALSINDQSLNISAEDTFTPLTEAGAITNGESQIKAVNELQSRLKELGVTAEGVEAQMQNVVGPELSQQYQALAEVTNIAEDEIKRLQQEFDKGSMTQQEFEESVRAASMAVTQQAQELQENAVEMSRNSNEALRLSGVTEESRQAFIDNGAAVGTNQHKIAQLRQQHRGLQQDIDQSTIKTLDFGQSMAAASNLISTTAMTVTSLIGLYKTLADENVSAGEKVTTVLTTIGFMLPMIITLFNEQNKALFLTIGKNLALAGSQAGLTASMEVTSFSALKLTAVMKGLGKTIGKFAIYAAAIAVVITAVSTLAKSADDARNSAENFAASATQGAKDAAEAYSEATTAFNELKQSIESYENALTGLQKLTQGTNEYKQALFDANEQALALVQSHAGLKYYIDSNGLIVFEQGELDRIEAEAQQKKADAYSAKLSADKAAREANIDYQKIQLGRKIKGQDYEWNNEDTAATGTGAAIGAGAVGVAGGIAGGALVGAKLGQLGWAAGPVGALIGTVAGVIVGGLVGAIGGAIASGFDNDATKQEQKAIDALYEAYKEQGNAALSEEGIRNALGKVDIEDENLIRSLAENKDATEELMQAMDANTAAIEAEIRSTATQQSHALDQNLQYKDSESQNAIIESMTRIRAQGGDKINIDPNSYRDAGLFNWWYNGNQTGKEAFNAWATANGLTQKNVKATNYSDNYIEYEYIDDEGNTQQKKLQYSQLAAWQEAQGIDEYAESAYNSIKKAIEQGQGLENSEGLMSIIGGQNLMSLSEKEFETFKQSYQNDEYYDFILYNWKTLGYESKEAFIKELEEGIANYDPEEAFAKFSKTINAEIDGILKAGAEETEYTTGALENYTEALAKNNEVLHDNTDAWSNLEKKKFAAQAAVANAKFVKGVDALTDVLKDNLDILLRWDEASLDTYEAADKVQTALEDVFGLRVSADYVKNNLEDIQALAQGNTENLKEMSRAAAIDFVLNIDTLSEEDKNSFASMIDELANIASDGIEIGTNIEDIDDSQYIEQLNQMLSAGKITAEQIQQAFGALGYSPDVKFKEIETETSTTHWVYDNPEDPNASPKKIVSITKNKSQIPYIAGKNTFTPASEDGSSSGQEKGTGITKIRDVGSIGASLQDTKKEAELSERYHYIREQLEDLERLYDSIGKAKNRAFGADKLALMGKEAAAISDLIDKQEKYLDEINSNFSIDYTRLAEYSEVEFDIYGRVSNADALLEKFKGNETFKEVLDQYEETLNLLEAEEEKYRDLINQELDAKLEKIKYELELEISLSDDSLKTLEYQIDKLGEGFEKVAEAILLYNQKMTEYGEQMTATQDTFEKFLNEKKFTEEAKEKIRAGKELEAKDFIDTDGNQITLTEEEITSMRQWKDDLISYEQSAREAFRGISESIISGAEDFNDKLNKNADSIKRYGEIANGVLDIVDLLGGSLQGSDEIIQTLTDQQITSAKAAATAAKISVTENREALKEAQNARDAEAAKGDKADKDVLAEWDKTIEALTENVEKAEDDWMSTISEGLQTLADAFETNMNQIFKTFEKTAAGAAGTFENLQAQFDRQNEKNEWYLQDYEKAYQLSKLNRNIINSIDETDNVKAKQKLRELQEEMNALQEEGREVSQYELDNLQAKYDLRLAEIALEEAQNAKSQVRMSRDSEGNWSYVYTADQDKIDEAQQNYEDKLYNIQNLQQEYIQETQSQLVQLEADRAAALQEIMNDTTLSAEEKAAKMEEINAFYNEKALYWNDQLGIVLDDAKELYDNDMTNYANATGQKLIAANAWVDDFGETIYAQETGFTSLNDAYSKTAGKAGDLVENLLEAAGTYETNVKDLMDKAGASIEDVGNKADAAGEKMPTFADSIEEMAEDAKIAIGDEDTGLIGKMNELAAKNPFDDIVGNAEDAYENYNKAIKPYLDKNSELIGSIDKVIAKYSTLKTAQSDIDQTKRELPEIKTEKEIKTGVGYGNNESDKSLSSSNRSNFKYTEIKSSDQYGNAWLTTYLDEQGNEQWVWTETNAKEWLEAGSDNTNTPKLNFSKNNEENDDLSKYKVIGFAGDARKIYATGYKDSQGNSFDDGYTHWVYEGNIIDGKVLGHANGKIKLKYKWYTDEIEGWFNKEDLEFENDLIPKGPGEKFDTGGYTGEWDSSGRLAILHQKELVLNAADTENFLAAINIVRELSNAIDLRTLAYQSMFSQAASAASINSINQALQQEVTITAEFPNATDRNEIEEAFKSLVNHASQFANRKN